MTDVDPWVESMRRAEELRIALEKLAGLQGPGAGSIAELHRALKDYEKGTR